MHRVILFIVCLFAILPLTNLAAAAWVKIGDFPIDSLVKRGAFLLDDGNVYRPVSNHQKKKTASWQLGDSILVLQRKHKSLYLLVNAHNGERVKARIVHLKK